MLPLEPREPGRVSMYVCGPTVYAPSHLGHGRFSLVFDVLRRWPRGLASPSPTCRTSPTSTTTSSSGPERGRALDRRGRRRQRAGLVRGDGRPRGQRPTHDPHATAYVAEMVELIGELIDRGVAYVTDDGIYFSAQSVADYGLLARQSIDSLQAGARIEVGEQKRSPIDFVLWKFSKPGEPRVRACGATGARCATECVVTSPDPLGEGSTSTAAARTWPSHHENERAQAVADGKRFATHWVHNGFVVVEGGEKMSKSLNNFVNLAELVETADPRSYRLLVLRAHYRSPVEVTKASTADASEALARLDAFARRAHAAGVVASPDGVTGAAPDVVVVDEFRRRMDDDLDTPGAVALLFTTVHRAHSAFDEGRDDEGRALAAAALELCRAVGLELHGEAAAVPDAILAKAAARDAARAAKDWATADALRDELVADGYVVEDTPNGTQVRPG
ncbi:MAG: DALR domain-containing protein [Acidimicrobiales bacterium]